MRKSILSRFFSAISMVLVMSITILGVFFMFFASRYFQSDRLNLMNLCVVNAQAAFDDSLQEKDGITTEERRGKLRENLRLISNTTSTTVILADENGRCIVCTENNDCSHEGSFVPAETMKALSARDVSMQLTDTFADVYSGSYYTVGRAARDSRGNIIGYVFAVSDMADSSRFQNRSKISRSFITSSFLCCVKAFHLYTQQIMSFIALKKKNTENK